MLRGSASLDLRYFGRMVQNTQHDILCLRALAACREGAYTEEDVVRLGKEAGEQLKAEAGPDFFDW